MQNLSVLPHPVTRARLKAPKGLTQRLQQALCAIRSIPRDQVSPSGRWIEDHGRFLLGHAQALKSSVRALPSLPGRKGEPRVMALARLLLSAQEALTPAYILRQCRTALGEQEITQEELNALPMAIRAALMEQLAEPVSTCIREAELHKKALAWIEEMQKEESLPLPQDAMLMEKILSLLTGMKGDQGLEKMEQLLETEGQGTEEAARHAQEEMNRLGQKTGWIIRQLHQLEHLPFHQLQDRLSPSVAILRKEETYRKMDRQGRAYYLAQVCRIAKRLHVQQSAVARCAMDLAWDREGREGEAGYYLIHRPDLIGCRLFQRKGGKPPEKRRLLLLRGTLWLTSILFVLLGFLLSAPWPLIPLLPLCGSEIIRPVIYRLARRHFPPRLLPRLRIRRLTKEQRTLIVVPTLLTSPSHALQMARQLSVLRHANPDPFLELMLLGDFADSTSQDTPQDEEILDAGKEAVLALNQTMGGGFYYLQRKRQWDKGQRRFIGRDRKRGALEALNQLLVHGKSEDAWLHCSCDIRQLQGRYAYVITLDADTFLPPGAAHRLIGAMEHPLQKGHVGVIQPRMETGADTLRTRAQHLLGGRGGADLYGGASQDFYQDLFNRGSFVGKGIYAPGPWLKAMEGRIPAGRLLSHDLIEGELAQSALAEDICLYDGHPARLSGWQKRLHRWTRGDWQLLPFLRISSLSPLSRHKIWDNLRRSLAPIAQLTLLLAGAGLGRPLLCLLGLPWPFSGMGKRLTVLPGKVITLLDAVIRALYRQFISHRGLLSWVTAAQAEQGQSLPLSCVLFQLFSGSMLCFFSLLPGGFLPMVFLGLAWVFSPLFVAFVDAPLRGEAPFTPHQKTLVRSLARDTWRFFEDHVTRDTLYLPPDNVQLEPDKGPALRTSPTNIGLYMLSCCAAREMGFISVQQMAQRLSCTLDTLEKLETWQGQFYNWYELEKGTPLAPLFVSTVDSGNLAGCLFACAQYCRRHLAQIPPDMESLPQRMDGLLLRMDFATLYDPKRHLFYVGWDGEKGCYTAGHYDFMASEARITSFYAVMRGQVPRAHWLHLNRSLVRAGGGPALLSWGGTLFEYLMPALLLPHLPGTLLGESCKNAIRAQMGHPPRLPFGISESGYYAFDPDLNYQYRAFGLPALALSGETAGNVIAPYASMLALPFFPRAAACNLQRMQRLGWQDEHGLYEAADYSPQRVEGGPMLVKSHMAHHQGMILCAACNALCNQALVKAFMAPPVARAHAYLLMERAPRYVRRTPDMPPPREEEAALGQLSFSPTLTLPGACQALRGKKLTWLLSQDGQGYLAQEDQMLTRFFEQAGSPGGPQFYLRDEKSGAFCRPAAQGYATFSPGSIQYAMDWQGLRIRLICCIAPLSDMAIAWLDIENTGREAREIECISFLEPALCSQQADRAHSNFQDLSLRIIPLEDNGIACVRLPRSEGEEEQALFLYAAGDHISLRRQGDRLQFLGGQGSYAHPAQLDQDAGECALRLGDVITPCLSLRAGLRIDAGKKAGLSFQIGASAAASPLPPPLSPEKARAALSLAATQAQMTLRFLRMDGRLYHAALQLLGAIAFADLPHQGVFAPAAPDTLWRFGISGQLPLLLVLPRAEGDQALIRQLLKIHGYLRLQGIRFDLFFLCEEKDGYHQPLRDLIDQMCSQSPCRHLMGQEGGVHVHKGSPADIPALSGLARLIIRGGQSLHAQLAGLQQQAPGDPPSLPLPSLSITPPPLMHPNDFGGFTKEGDYCILRPAPQPWHNLLCNDNFGMLVSERSLLQSYAGNSRLGRLTRPSPDVYRGQSSESILLYTPDQGPRSLIDGMAVHGPGETSYHTQWPGLQSKVTLFVPPDLPLSIRMITLKSENEISLRLEWLIRFAMGERSHTTYCRAKQEMITACNGEMQGLGFAALSESHASTLSACYLDEHTLPRHAVPARQEGGSAGLLSLQLTMKCHETITLLAVLGHGDSEQQCREYHGRIVREGGSSLLRRTRAYWQRQLSGLALYSGYPVLDFMMNKWLPYQALAARLKGRMGPYQAGGAFGFRDQLQDLLCLLHTHPHFARNHILLCAAHQFTEGDVQHWWHMPRRGVRTRISDDKLFLPFLTSRYIQITGDQSILEESIPYLEAPPLSDQEEERYDEPAVSTLSEPLLSHCIRAIDSVSLGIHDLPLMGSGDWNDGMNRIGGKTGESVWLGFFLALVLKEFAPYCPSETKKRYQSLRSRLLSGGEQAWTGKWYLRAWYDSGEPLGGPDTHPPRIDLISQCFAVLSGAPRDHGRTALGYAVQLLYDRKNSMVKLLDPPFTPEERAGYIGGYLPGIRENGGQYTHAAPWLVMALCKIGQWDLAWEIALALLPAHHGDTAEKAQIYRTEPYVLCGDVYAGENPGRGGWSWYTGSAAWLYYVFLTVLLGFEKEGDRARLNPCPQREAQEYTLVYQYQNTRYHFTAGRDIPFPTLDGEKLTDGWAHLINDGRTHEARFPMRTAP